MAELTEADVAQIVQQELAARLPQAVRDELARQPVDTPAATVAEPAVESKAG